MANEVHVLNQHQIFIKALLAIYKEKRLLWDRHHPQYRSRSEREEAYGDLLQKCREFHIDADKDFVRLKIESMRSSFRKERRKVLALRQCQYPNNMYKPALWYYDLLLFTVGEEAEDNNTESELNAQENESSDEDSKTEKTPMWCTEYSTYLISQYKKHPCLYDTTNPHYKIRIKRTLALKKIQEGFKLATGRTFNIDDIKKKISFLRSQFLFELRKTKNNPGYRSSLWCYESLSFLKRHVYKKTKSPSKTYSFEDETENELENLEESKPKDDNFDTIAKNVAHKLRSMSPNQRAIAERLIRDVLYHGQMGNLTADSKLVI